MTIDRDRTPGMGTHASAETIAVANAGTQYVPLHLESRPTVDTAAAAYYLSRRPQTLRCWATYDKGPIRPLRVHGRLAWPVANIRAVLGVA